MKINQSINRILINKNLINKNQTLNKNEFFQTSPLNYHYESIPSFLNSHYFLGCNKNTMVLNKPSFKKAIDEYDRRQCKKIINQSATACSAIAGTVGKASAFGIDPWLQRGVQTAMFLYLADYLEVPPAAATFYSGLEFYSGARLGVEAAKMLTSASALLTDVATGGSSVLITEGATRGGNALLSFLLTRRMGNGFVKQVESNNMTTEKQLLRVGQYGARKAFMGGFDAVASISDLDEFNDIDHYKSILDNISDEDKSLIGKIYDSFFQEGIERAPSVFLANLMPTLITKGLKGEKTDKNLFKTVLKDTLITTAVYELCNIAVDGEITGYAMKKYNDLTKSLIENSDVYEDFNDMLEKVAMKIKAEDYEKMDNKEFLKQFKNKEFVFELSRTIETEVKSFNKKLKEKKKGGFEAEKNNLICKSAGFKTRIKDIGAIEDTNERKKINKTIKTIVSKSKDNGEIKDFGFNTIAGYDDEKIKLNNAIGALLQTDDVESFELPNVILLYGPRGVGKTTLCKAAATEYGCRCIKKTFVGNKADIMGKIEKIANEAKKQYETAVPKRHTILIMDECTSFLSDTQNNEDELALKKFNDFISNCSEKYHMSIFMTTNYPQLIDEEIFNNKTIGIKMLVKNADKYNIKEILKYYAPEREKNKINYDIIADKIVEKAGKNAFSNSQLEIIGRCRPVKGKLEATNAQEKMLKLLYGMKPEISEEDIKQIASIEKHTGTS